MNDTVEVSKKIKMLGWLVMVAGLLAVLAPFIAGGFIVIMVGLLILIAGVTRITHAVQGGGFWTGIFGLVYVIAGVMIVVDPLPGLLALTMLLTIYFMVIGIAEIIAAFQMRPGQGWGFLLFSGVVSTLLALMLWNQWPLSGNWAVGTLVGIQLIFSGMTMFTVGSLFKGSSEILRT